MSLPIDDFINSMDFDPRTVMVSTNDIPPNQHPSNRFEEKDTYIVVKKEIKSLTKDTADLTYIDTIASRLYPGVMVKCNNDLIENNPSIVNVKTKPMRFNIDLPSSNTVFEVSELTKGNLDNEINKKIREWKNENPSGNITAKVKYKLIDVKNEHKLSTDLGFHFEKGDKHFDIDFKAIEEGKSRDWIIKLEQIYYNVTLERFTKPSDIISDEVTVAGLQEFKIDNRNPLGIINNVSYGRIVYIHINTHDNTLDINSHIEAIVKNVDVKNDSSFHLFKSKVSCNVYVYGGGTSNFNKVGMINIDNVHDFINSGYNFDISQSAAPIGYSVVYMKHGGSDLAKVSYMSNYVETTVSKHNRVHIHIRNNAWYTAHYDITWETMWYDENGNLKYEKHAWDRNGKNVPKADGGDIFIPGNVTNIHLHAKGYTGILWDKWRHSFDGSLELHPRINITTTGTTLNQKCHIEYSEQDDN